MKVARDERKTRVAKNEKQRLGNLARGPSDRDHRKHEIDKTLATTRISTASVGKFDKKLEGEKKLRGVKRKVILFTTKFETIKLIYCSSSIQSRAMKQKIHLPSFPQLDGDSKRSRKDGGDDVLNVRKAIRTASRGRGAIALGRDGGGGRGSKGKRGGKR